MATVETILEDCSYHLIEKVVNTAITGPPAMVFPPGVNTITPGSMTGIYLGAQLLVDVGNSQEVATVASVTATTFTTTFTKAHNTGALIVAATFPSGQTDHPLFTQQEMIGYVADVQNDFLLKVRPVYNVVVQAVSAGVRFYQQPSDAIRIERLAIEDMDLYDTTQADMDLIDASWPQVATTPRFWFQDETTTPTSYGYREIPQVNDAAELWYSQSAPSQLSLISILLVPDYMSHYVKYGVLARAYSKDGEQRDPKRAEYCQKRFDLGVQLSIRMLEATSAVLTQNQQRTPSNFSPMAVQG